jgi:hypothetical protein
MNVYNNHEAIMLSGSFNKGTSEFRIINRNRVLRFIHYILAAPNPSSSGYPPDLVIV